MACCVLTEFPWAAGEGALRLKMSSINFLINFKSDPDASQSADRWKANRPKRKQALVPEGRYIAAYRASDKDTQIKDKLASHEISIA